MFVLSSVCRIGYDFNREGIKIFVETVYLFKQAAAKITTDQGLELNSSFFLNWCNVNPDKITKWDQLWFRGFVSIILNPFLRVFAISAFLKVF